MKSRKEKTMIRIIATLLGIFLLAGCASEGRFISSRLPNSCGGTGHTFVLIKYGDSHIAAKAVITVRAGKELQYRLIPDRGSSPVDYEDVLVTITSKVPPNPLDGSWVEAAGSYDSSGGVLKVCVPNSTTATEYYYKIDVATVGELDPRADVQL